MPLPSLFRILPAPLGLTGVIAALSVSAVSHAQTFTYGSAPSVAPRVYAIENARIVTENGKPIEKGIVVLRDGLIVGVGEKLTVPPDAKIVDATGMTIYPGFIDAFTTAGMPGVTEYPAVAGDAYRMTTVRSDNNASSLYKPESALLDARRKAGFGAMQVAPSIGIFSGTSAVVSTGIAGETAGLVVRSPLMMRMDFDAVDSTRGYPESLMGEIALARQALYDTQDAMRREAAYEKDPRGLARPATTRQLAALEGVLTGKMPLVIHADNAPSILRALKFDKEFNIHPVIEGASEAYRVIPQLKEAGATVLLTLNLPEPPTVRPNTDDPTTLQDLRRRTQAPLSAHALSAAGIPFALSTEGMQLDKFNHNVRRLIAAGLSEDQAIAALTADPARLLGVDRQLGTIETGKIADLLVVEGGTPFDGKSKIRYSFVDGEPMDIGAAPARSARASAPTVKAADISLPPGVTPAQALQFLRTNPDAAKPFLPAGVTVEQAIAQLEALVEGKSTAGPDTSESPTAEVIPAPPAVGDGMVPPLPPQLPATFVLRNAAEVWTVGPKGTIPNADVFVRGGVVIAVGQGLSVPSGTLEIDARGKHITPGMIDCHSHTAISGGVNEGSNIVTAECRIEDVLNPDDVNIYRELAGGTTTANVLHGSANAIGGQNAVVKWRWGGTAADLMFGPSAPQGIKFALGENPKQSNFQFGTPRYPESRMGVEKVIRQALMRARDYRDAWAEYKKGHRADPPRRDLQLDALVEVLDGTRYVHCHSYRQDEILMLIRVADEFGFHIRTFQHGLEGYKVADEIRAHGAGVSTFSDWWAYKEEAYDAIPYNGALLEQRGVVTSFNSDSDELARRLNYEAAKAVHWGGMKPEEAIKLLTINPAIQLGIDKHVGSLEPGKDADIAIWSGDPLSTHTICEKTFVDGKLMFDRQADLAARAGLDAEKKRLADFEKPPARPAAPTAPPPGVTPIAPPFADGGMPVVTGTPTPVVPANPVVVTPTAPQTPQAAPAKTREATGQPGPTVPLPAPPTTTTPDPAVTPAGGSTVKGQVPPGTTPPLPVPGAPLPQKPYLPATPTGPITALVGATVHPVSGADIPNGVVLMQGGQIIGVGASGALAIPDGARTVDLTGKHVYPGLIDANTALGINEIESIRATNDDSEMGDFNPDLRTIVAVNPDSELLPVARQNGILSAVSAPKGGTISGIGALIALDGWSWEDMTLDRSLAMYMNFPSLGGPRFFDNGERDEADRTDGTYGNTNGADSDEDDGLRSGRVQPPATPPTTPATTPNGGGGRRRRGGGGPGGPGNAPGAEASADAAIATAEKPINDLLDAARQYRTALLAEGARDVPTHPRDPRFDALLPVIDGRMPMIVRANAERDIRAAIAWAKTQNIRIVLLGGTDADKCADQLLAANIPVILDPVLALPRRRDQPYDDPYTLPLRLYRAGVRFCISTGDAADVRRLPWQSGMAAAFGLPSDVALRAITLSSAEILGAANRIGSLDAGKDATLIVTDGDPLEITTVVLQAWDRGVPVDLTTKQTRLYNKYRARPRH